MTEHKKAGWLEKGRGSQVRVVNRFQKQVEVPEDDGWGSLHEFTEEQSRARTTVTEENARSVVTRNSSPDVGFEASINPYRGCEHGCFYCFARPSHSYLDLSPGLDFETKLFAKTNAVEVLRSELAKPGYKPTPIALGINTDAYQPIEKRYQLTRRILELLLECRHPVHFVTKNALILRDLDLLQELARLQLVHVAFSVTSLDNRLSAKMEPRASAPHARLDAMKALSDEGVSVGVMVAPVIPMLTDVDLENILERARESGATSAGYVLLRLPHELKALSRDWLEAHFPDRAAHIMSLMQQMHGGQDYVSEFGTRMRGTGPFAQLIEQRFRKAKARLGFTTSPVLSTSLFVPPSANTRQGQLF